MTTNPAEPEVHIELMSDSWKKTVLEKFPRCKSAEGIRDTSYFVTTTKGQCNVSSSTRRAAASRASANLMGHPPAVGNLSNIQCLQKLLSELNRMEYEDTEQLPGGTAPIWLRYDDECPQYMRAIITGPPRDTPYSNGLFTFGKLQVTYHICACLFFNPHTYMLLAASFRHLCTRLISTNLAHGSIVDNWGRDCAIWSKPLRGWKGLLELVGYLEWA